MLKRLALLLLVCSVSVGAAPLGADVPTRQISEAASLVLLGSGLTIVGSIIRRRRTRQGM